MSLKKYTSNQLLSVLESFFDQNNNGILSLQTQVDSWHQQRSCILILRDGELVYGGTQVPNNQELCRRIGETLKPNLIKAGLSVAIEKAKNPNSAIEILEMLIRMRAFTWQEVEALMNKKVLLILEQFIIHPGTAQWEISDDFDLAYGQDRHGLNWTDIRQELKHRQQQWLRFTPQIPSMDAIPVVTTQQLRLIDNPQVKDHFRNSVDGARSLVDIADKMGKDPLKVAKNYLNWVNNNWVSFTTTPNATRDISEVRHKISENLDRIHAKQAKDATNSVQSQDNQHLPIVLSVDDSAIIQISIKRALQDSYKVLLANNATQALEILHQSKVELMLLDLTMPDVDGLEFCKTIRAMSKFQNLPIVMVTARDGLVNKMRGRIAGTSRYLTKPFKPEELRQVVQEYIKQ
ncbi:MAG: response regulator [Cyanobacteria bacterium P01_A01_bin.40]